MIDRRSLLKGLAAVCGAAALPNVSSQNPVKFVPHPFDRDGFLYPNGRLVPRDLYPKLFNVISTAYGNATDENFSLPDFDRNGYMIATDERHGFPAGTAVIKDQWIKDQWEKS